MTLGTAPEAASGSESDSESRSRAPGEEGLWVFLLGDMMMFALFFGVLLVTRSAHLATWRAGQDQLHPALGIANTLLLVCGSYAVVLGVRRYGDGTRRASQLFAVCLTCAAAFAALKVVEYTLLGTAGYSGATNDFFMYYFVFTGIHLAHLLIGAVLMAVLTVSARRPATATSRRFVEGCACYWHMVDLLWLLLFPILYLVR